MRRWARAAGHCTSALDGQKASWGRRAHAHACRLCFRFSPSGTGTAYFKGSLYVYVYTIAAPSKAVLMPRGRLLCKLPSVCLHSVSLIVLMATGRQLWKENEDHLEAAASLSLCVLETGLMAVDCRNKLSYSPDGAALVCA